MKPTLLAVRPFHRLNRSLVSLVALASLIVHCGSPQGTDVPSTAADATTDAPDQSARPDATTDTPDTSFDSFVAPADVPTSIDTPSIVDAAPLMDVPSDGFRDGYSVMCLSIGGTCVVGSAQIVTGPIYGSNCPPGTVAYNSGNEGLGESWDRYENRYGAGCGLARGGILPIPIVCCIPAPDAR